MTDDVDLYQATKQLQWQSNLKIICCIGEKECIPNPKQLACYHCIDSEISVKILYLRLFMGSICWASTVWAIIYSIFYKKDSTDFLMFFYWFLYYTHWVMLCQNIYWIITIAINYIIYKRFVATNKYEKLTKYEEKLFYVCKITNIFGVCGGVGLSFVYWTMVWDGQNDSLFLLCDVWQHGINAFLITIDFLLSLIVYRYKDWWIIFIWAVIYQLFNFLYVILGGRSEDGYNYLYIIYDWNNSPIFALIQCIIFIVSHVTGYLFLATFLKKVLLNRYINKCKNTEKEIELR